MSTSNTDIYSYINNYSNKKKSVRLVFPHENRRELKVKIIKIIIIIKWRTLSPSHLVFVFISNQSLFFSLSLSICLSLFSLFLFFLIFKDTYKRTLLVREGKSETTLNYMSKDCLRACDSAGDTSSGDDVVVVFVRHHA